MPWRKEAGSPDAGAQKQGTSGYNTRPTLKQGAIGESDSCQEERQHDQISSRQMAQGSDVTRMQYARVRWGQEATAERLVRSGRTGRRGPCPDGVRMQECAQKKIRTRCRSDVASCLTVYLGSVLCVRRTGRTRCK